MRIYWMEINQILVWTRKNLFVVAVKEWKILIFPTKRVDEARSNRMLCLRYDKIQHTDYITIEKKCIHSSPLVLPEQKSWAKPFRMAETQEIGNYGKRKEKKNSTATHRLARVHIKNWMLHTWNSRKLQQLTDDDDDVDGNQGTLSLTHKLRSLPPQEKTIERDIEQPKKSLEWMQKTNKAEQCRLQKWKSIKEMRINLPLGTEASKKRSNTASDRSVC